MATHFERVKAAVEAEYDLPFWDVVRGYANDGCTLQLSARCLGLGCNTLHRLMQEDGVHVVFQGSPHDPPAVVVSPVETIDGFTGTLTQHARRSGLGISCVRNRVQRGWTLERAIKEPNKRKGKSE